MLLTILLILKIGLFVYLTRIEYNQILIFLVGSLITLFFFTWIYFSNSKKKQTLAFSFYNIISAIMFIDALYYHYFNSLPSITLISQMGQVAAVGDSVKELLNPLNILFLVDIPFLFIYSSRKKKKIKREGKVYNRKLRIGVPGGIGLVTVIIFLITYSLGYGTALEKQELYTYHFKDLGNIFKSDNVVEGEEDFSVEEISDENQLPLRGNNSSEEKRYNGIGKDKNLIVIQVEALQNFVINNKYEGQEITPNINKLIKDQSSIYFDNYYQLVGRGNTSDAEFVSQNSLYPTIKDGSYALYEDNTFYGLPWILRDEGYTSWVFHGYEPEFWNRKNAYPNQGFERFISQEDFNVEKIIGFGLIDEEFFKQSIPYIKEMGEPFYSFMITLTSHTPFNMPEYLHVLDIKEEHKGTMFANYLQSIHYADKAIGEFIEELKKEGLYENTVIALYGDHSALHCTNEENKKIMTEYLGYNYDYQDVMNVPLIVHVPGQNINETISTVGCQLDFLPTMLNIMGLENEKGIMFGIDLLNSTDSLVAQQNYLPTGSYFDNEKQFIMAGDGIYDHSRCHDLKTREPIELEKAKENYEKAIKEINLSNYILQNDLIKELINGSGNIKIEEKTKLNMENMDYIAITENNSREDLDRAYKNGFKMIELDLSWNKDKEKVEIKNSNMDVNDLINWIEGHEDSYIVINVEENEKVALRHMKETYPDIVDRFIPQIHDMSNYSAAFVKGFDNILLNLNIKEYKDEEILDFINRCEILGVVIDKDRGKGELPKKLEKEGLLTYVYDINNENDRKTFKENNAYGIFTKKLIP